MTFVGRACIAVVRATTLAGCAPSLRQEAPDALYAQLVESRGWPRCTPISAAALRQARDEQITRRFDAVRPWLEQEIGREEIDRIYTANQQTLEEVSFVGCPSENFSAWQNMTVRRVLREMERRQRKAARLRRPAADLPADRAHPETGVRSLPR
jgi:hypothetical protein